VQKCKKGTKKETKKETKETKKHAPSSPLQSTKRSRNHTCIDSRTFRVKTFSSLVINTLQIDFMESIPFQEYVLLDQVELELYCYDMDWLPTRHTNELVMYKEPLMLLRYVSTCFELHGILNHNKTVLLYGVPGSGKTTLFHLVSQWIAIRFGPTKKIHIDASQFLSKYLGESSRLLHALFQEILNHKGNTILMVDEIESLARNRQDMNQEPVDSIRLVNSFLVGLDQCSKKPGFFCFLTSNVMNLLDHAILDRCDLRIRMEPPTADMRFTILQRDMDRLVKAGKVQYDDATHLLRSLCVEMEGVSGRFVSKLCFLAFAGHGPLQTCTELVESMRETWNKGLQ
jgi:Cdc6-like AAA superfamily ATPase